MFDWAKTDRWHALFVKTGEEDEIKRQIDKRLCGEDQFRLLVPKRRLRERKQGTWRYMLRNMFPGYVLVNGIMNAKTYYTLKEIPGLYFFLKDKNHLCEIQDDEIESILRMIGFDDTIGTSRGYMQGDKVHITQGPLVGFEAMIDSINKRKGRARVRMQFMGQPRLVDLDLSLIDAY
jgi:transcription termination/antitermination protein NusG